jgi:hypothetical protein
LERGKEATQATDESIQATHEGSGFTAVEGFSVGKRQHPLRRRMNALKHAPPSASGRQSTIGSVSFPLPTSAAAALRRGVASFTRRHNAAQQSAESQRATHPRAHPKTDVHATLPTVLWSPRFSGHNSASATHSTASFTAILHGCDAVASYSEPRWWTASHGFSEAICVLGSVLPIARSFRAQPAARDPRSQIVGRRTRIAGRAGEQRTIHDRSGEGLRVQGE